MEKKSLSTGFIVMILVGLILFIYSFIIPVPSEELSYDSYYGVSQIEKYLNGDAYNYVVGANIVGSKIVAATIKKAIFICFGLFMTTFGIGMLVYGKRSVEQSSQAFPDKKEVNG